jgi:hypothetical protein
MKDQHTQTTLDPYSTLLAVVEPTPPPPKISPIYRSPSCKLSVAKNMVQNLSTEIEWESRTRCQAPACAQKLGPERRPIVVAGIAESNKYLPVIPKTAIILPISPSALQVNKCNIENCPWNGPVHFGRAS